MRPRLIVVARLMVLGVSLACAALLLLANGRSDQGRTFVTHVPAVANDEPRPGGTATPPFATSTATATRSPSPTPTATPKPDYEAAIEEVERWTYGLYIRLTLRVRDDDGLASMIVDFGGGLPPGKITLPPTVAQPIILDATYGYGALGQTLTPSITTTDLKGGTTTRALTSHRPATKVFEVRTTFEVAASGSCDWFSADNELLITASVFGVSLGTRSVYDPPTSYVPVPFFSIRHHQLTAQATQDVRVTVTVYEQDAFLEGANDFLGTKSRVLTLEVGSSSGSSSSLLMFEQASPECYVYVRVNIVFVADPRAPL